MAGNRKLTGVKLLRCKIHDFKMSKFDGKF